MLRNDLRTFDRTIERLVYIYIGMHVARGGASAYHVHVRANMCVELVSQKPI